MIDLKNNIWVEKYRPKTIDDLILPDRLKKVLNGIVESKEVLGYIFYGTPGTGKTSMAKIICELLDFEYMVINGSEENGIDTIRTKFKDYGSFSSLNGNCRVIIFDEGERLSYQAMDALKNPIELLSDNLRVIFTTNDIDMFRQKDKDKAIRSRLNEKSFEITKDEIELMLPDVVRRIFYILDNEKVSYSKKNKSLIKFIKKHMPDLRNIIKSLQQLAIENNNSIPEKFIVEDNELTVDKFRVILNGQHKDIAQFINENSREKILKFVYDNIEELSNNNLQKLKDLHSLTTRFDYMVSNVLFINNALVTYIYELASILNK